MAGNPSIMMGQGGGNSGFWGSIANKLGAMGTGASNYTRQTGSSSGGLGSTIGGMGGAAIGTAIGGPVGGAIGGALGSAAGDTLEGGILGGGESGEDKLKEEQAQSEHETRRWEERNAAPTAGIGQYLARATALQGFPVLGAINNLDFLFNKILPYAKSYGPGQVDWRGNTKR